MRLTQVRLGMINGGGDMEKLRWYIVEPTVDNKEAERIEKKLKRKSMAIYRFCKRHKLTYADIYVLSDSECSSVNIRAKRKEEVVSDGYAFIRKGL